MSTNDLCKKFIGRQFDQNEFNCYTLVIEWYKELGKELPNHQNDEGWYKKGKNYFIDEYYKLWKKIPQEEVKENDVVLFKILSPVPNHIGIYIGSGRFIHCQENIGTTIGTLNRFQRVLVGCYRLKEFDKCL